MKKRYIALILFLLFEIFVDLQIEVHNDLYFEDGVENPKIELFNYYNSNWEDTRKYLIRHYVAEPPYTIVTHIILDDPAKLKSISATIDQEVLFDLDYDQITTLPDGVIVDEKKDGFTLRKYTLDYSNQSYHPDGYYTLYFERVFFDNDHPLIISITYLDNDGREVTETAVTKYKTRKEWTNFYIFLGKA
ncbi:MAG: hypothetical protein R3D86_13320 [Emcibacteraceae bacterium]